MSSNEYCAYSGKTEPGFVKNGVNEDYIGPPLKLGDWAMFFCIADGNGSNGRSLQPATLVFTKLYQVLKRKYALSPEMLQSFPAESLKEAVMHVNDYMCAFKTANEELYASLSSTVTCYLLTQDGHLYFAHCGNTRLYLITPEQIIQLTDDHTVAQLMVKTGALSEDRYYSDPDRLNLTSSLGREPNPQIDGMGISISKNSFLLLTTDGVHYSLTEKGLHDLVIKEISESGNLDKAVNSILEEVKRQHNTFDNISAWLTYYGKIT